MGGVSGFVPEDLAGYDDADRRLMAFHVPDLDRRGVGAEHMVRLPFYIESVLHVAGRVVPRDIQQIEVIAYLLQLRTFGENESEFGEYRVDLGDDMGQRVFVAGSFHN